MNAPIKIIKNVDELQSGVHGLYSESFDSQKVTEFLSKHKDFWVSKDAIIYTLSTQNELFKIITNIVKHDSKNKYNYRVVSADVMAFLRNVTQKKDVSERTNDSESRTDEQSLWRQCISTAYNLNASDIHLRIKPAGEPSAVLVRVDGRLRRMPQFDGMSGDKLISMIRAAVNYDAIRFGGDAAKPFSLSEPNDAKVPVSLDDNVRLQIRVGVMPGSGKDCGKVTLRLLADNGTGKQKTFEELGFADEQCALIREAISLPFGAVFFTGPTGSGKSTGIASALNEVDPAKSIITLENPIENVIDNDACIQSPVNEDVETLRFAPLLRSSLRNDPDVIMVGEVRDEEVAATSARAAATGHLLLTTLHVNTALEVPSALEYYKLSLHTITERSFLRCIVAQRLIPKLCTSCRIKLSTWKATVFTRRDQVANVERIKKHFADKLDSIYILNKNGCKECYHTGQKGRVLIAEVVKIDSLARDSIKRRDYDGWRKSLKQYGWYDMKDHAETRVIKGEICPIAVEGDLLTPFGVDTVNDVFDYTKFREELASVNLEILREAV